MKQSKPKVVRDFRGQDYVQTSNVCGNTTYVRNYQVEYQLSLAPEHVNKLLTSLSENVQLERYQHRELKMVMLKLHCHGTSPGAEVDVRKGRNDIVNKELTA